MHNPLIQPARLSALARRLARLPALVALILFTLRPGALWPQGAMGRIAGSVLDPGDRPLEGAEVVVVGTRLAAQTDADGSFFFNAVPPGTYSLRASYPAHRSVEFHGVQVRAGETTRLNVRLAITPVTEAMVIDTAPAAAPISVLASKATLTGETVNQLPVDNVRQALKLLPGVSESGSSEGLVLRGGHPGEAGVYVDGVPVRSSLGAIERLLMGTNAVEEVSVTTGGLSAEFGDLQSGLINLVTRGGGRQFRAALSYETEGPFGNGMRVGFNRMEGFIGGPLLSGLSFFVAGTLQGQQADLRGTGAEHLPTFVPGPVDTVVMIGSGLVDTVPFDIPQFIQFSGQCDPAENHGSPCQGRRFPYDWTTASTGLGKLAWSYAGGSRLAFTALLNQNQHRFWPGTLSFNPGAYHGTRASSQAYILSWRQRLMRRATREVALGLSVSYQSDESATGILDPTWDVEHRSATGGIVLDGMDFVVDFNRFSADTGSRAVTRLESKADWQQLVENTRVNRGTRLPYLDRGDLRMTQSYRKNPWAVISGFPTAGLDPGFANTQLARERRWFVRALADWQAGRTHRIKVGGELLSTAIEHFAGRLIDQADQNVYAEEPRRYTLFAQDQVEYSTLVLDIGLRWDVFDSRALYPVTPLRIFTHPNFNPDDPTNPADSVFARAESHGVLQPRLKASWQLFSRTSLRATYAHQAQAPDFALLFANKNADLINISTASPNGRDVDLAKTILYELGMRHAFGPGLALDLAVFTRSKRAEHSFRYVDFFDPLVGRISPRLVLTNADTSSSVTGFEIGVLWRHSDWFAGQVSYSLQDADGTSGFRETRKHNIAGWLGLSFPDAFHRGSWYGEILRNGGLWAQFRFASGLPYERLRNAGVGWTAPRRTVPVAVPSTVDTESMPRVYDLDLRVTKGFRLAGALWSVFLDIRNLFDFTNVVEIFAETGETTNDEFFQSTITSELTRLRGDAGSARQITIVKDGETLEAIDLSDCSGWTGPGREASCLLVRRAETRWGDGDGVYDQEEHITALRAAYDQLHGEWTKLGQPRHIRIGLQLDF
jgi:hypothetical protein